MQTLRDLIERHGDKNGDFLYYLSIIDTAESNEEEFPDITIECCTSLLQGISKTIVHRLDPPTNFKAFDDSSVQSQVRAALRCLAASDDVIEIDFPRRAESLFQIIAELRNQRGDISHGRVVPKEQRSDRSLARLILNLTEAILRYMLATYFAMQPKATAIPPYEDNEAFNNYLDESVDLPDKVIYSRALYDQVPVDYLIRLKNYIDETDVTVAEFDTRYAEGSDDGDAD